MWPAVNAVIAHNKRDPSLHPASFLKQGQEDQCVVPIHFGFASLVVAGNMITPIVEILEKYRTKPAGPVLPLLIVKDRSSGMAVDVVLGLATVQTFMCIVMVPNEEVFGVVRL
jgi:hypothetical protein